MTQIQNLTQEQLEAIEKAQEVLSQAGLELIGTRPTNDGR